MTTIRSLMRMGQWSLDAVSQSFAPPPNATSKSVRIQGAVCIGVGIVCVVVFGAGIAVLHAPAGLLAVPSLLGYAFFSVGGYRLIRGKEPAAQYPGEISLARIALACLSVVFCFSLIIGLVLVAAALFDK